MSDVTCLVFLTMPRPSEEPSRRSANLRSRAVRTKRRQTLVPLVIAVLGFSVWFAFSGFQIQFQNNTPSDLGTCVAHPVILDDSTTVLAGLSDSFNFSDPIVHEYAGLVNRYLAPWGPIPVSLTFLVSKQGAACENLCEHFDDLMECTEAVVHSLTSRLTVAGR